MKSIVNLILLRPSTQLWTHMEHLIGFIYGKVAHCSDCNEICLPEWAFPVRDIPYDTQRWISLPYSHSMPMQKHSATVDPHPHIISIRLQTTDRHKWSTLKRAALTNCRKHAKYSYILPPWQIVKSETKSHVPVGLEFLLYKIIKEPLSSKTKPPSLPYKLRTYFLISALIIMSIWIRHRVGSTSVIPQVARLIINSNINCSALELFIVSARGEDVEAPRGRSLSYARSSGYSERNRT